MRREAERAREWGVKFGEPELDLDRIRAWKQEVVDTLTRGLGSLADRRDIEHIRGRARFSDETTLEVSGPDGGRSLLATDIVLSTGSRARMLPMMPGADRDLVKAFHAENQSLFERTLLSTRVDEVKSSSDGLEVSFSGDGAPDDSFRYDAILVATGRAPVLDELGLEIAGVEVNEDGFVSVDEQMRTSARHVFAAGDIAGPPLLAHKGQHEGRIAGAVLGGEEHVVNDVRAIPAVEYTDPEVAWVGLTENEAASQGRKVKVSRFSWKASGRALTMGRSDGLTKLILDPETERILGVGITGAHAGELIGEAAHAIEMASTARDLELTVHPHPTLSETLRGAAERFYGTATDI